MGICNVYWVGSKDFVDRLDVERILGFLILGNCYVFCKIIIYLFKNIENVRSGVVI